MTAIRKIRRSQDITQEQLASGVGVSQQAVAAWERGLSSPRAELLPKLADILGCTVDGTAQERRSNEHTTGTK